MSLALCAVQPIAPNNGAPPEWLHLLPIGKITARDGRGPFYLNDVAAVVASSIAQAGGKLVLDENHSTDLAAPKGESAPAYGWIVQLQARADGVWGRVNWTPSAMGRRIWTEYRGVSPVIAHRKDGTIEAVLRASLVNAPNLVGLTSLHFGLSADGIDRKSAEELARPGDKMDEVDQAIAVYMGIDPKRYTELLSSSGFRDQIEPMRRRFLMEGIRLVDEKDVPLSAADNAIISKMALDPKAYRANLAAEGLRTSLHRATGLAGSDLSVLAVMGTFAKN
ncbi:MAG: phage protease [Sphingobium limneticum]